MKTMLMLSVTLCMLVASACQPNNKPNDMKPEKLLRHVVIFKFKDSSSVAQVKTVVDTFMRLKTKVPQVVDMEFGTNMSPEHFNEGFTHCFVLTYKSEKDLADYQLHPAHKAFQEVLKPHMDKVFVVDYWVGE